MAIHIYDNEDSFPRSFMGDNYVDTIFIFGYLEVSSSPSAPRTFFGTHGRSAMRLSFQAVCSQNYYGADCGTPCASTGSSICEMRICINNYYGPNCTTFCEERDDEQGHYICDSEGNIVCRDGYNDTSTNCTECIPADGCCEFHYTLVVTDVINCIAAPSLHAKGNP